MTRDIGEKIDGVKIWKKLEIDIYFKLFQRNFFLM